MNWNTFQVRRARHLRNSHNYMWLAGGIIVYGLALISLAVLLASLIVPVSFIYQDLALAFIGPALLIGSYRLFLGYLALHPEYLLPTTLRNEPLNNFDFQTLEIIDTWHKNNWQWATLAKIIDLKPEFQEVFYRLGLVPQLFAQMNGSLEATTAESVINSTVGVVTAQNRLVNCYDFIHQLLLTPGMSSVLVEHKITAPILDKVLLHYQNAHQARQILKTRWLKPQLHRDGGFAKDWSVSYTNTLDNFTSEIPPEIENRVLFTPLLSREGTVDQALSELNKDRGQNLLLVGDSGSGKTEIFYHIASRIIHFQTKTELDGAHVRTFDFQKVLSAAGNKEALQKLLDVLFSELSRAGNIILFIDRIDLLLSPGEKVGAVDLSAIFQNYLEHPHVRIVGTISNEAYISLVKNNNSLEEVFSVVKIEPPTKEDLLTILLGQVNRFEARYQVFFTAEALLSIVEQASRYLKQEQSPQRELTLIEEISSSAMAGKSKIITEKEVLTVLEKKTGVPIQVSGREKDTLLNLTSELHKSVVGQDRAIQLLSDALMRARAGLGGDSKPIGSFLFLGPTGVGKTETAKTLARVYFGNEQKLLRLDMTEFADGNALTKLLGTNLVSDPGALSIAIQENPSAVLLFDEIEKSHPYVQNALLQVLDEGRLTTNYGKVLDFTNTIIIATSNAGSEYIREQVSQNIPVAQFEKALVDQLIKKKIFLTEWLNRFEAVVVFAPLKTDEVAQIVAIQIEKLKAEVRQNKGIELEIAPLVINELATKGYDPVFGARALQRTIREDLETVIARQIIAQNPGRGAILKIEAL